jgi:HK97 family phage major capsid protein
MSKWIEVAGEAYNNMRGLLDEADKRDGEKKGKLEVDEQRQYDAWEDQYDSAMEKHETEQRMAERAKALASVTDQRGGRPNPTSGKPAGGGNDEEARAALELRAFSKYLAKQTLTEEEQRALQADSDPDGGFLVPKKMGLELIQAIKDNGVVRQIARVLPPLLQAASIGNPSLDSDLNDADWTPEIGAVTEDTALKFGMRELSPHQVSKLVKISAKLLRNSALPVEAIVMDRLGYKFGITEEKVFMTGTGAGQPLGLFTASSQGISSARDVNTGNTATAIVADNLFDNLYSLKEGYQVNATWLFHRLAVKQIRKLKDSTNQYIWQPGLANGNPGTILERPYRMSEYVPSTFTTGKYVGMVGDFQYYWIQDALSMMVQRLVELYATTNQVGFIGRKEVDAMPVLEEAFSRVTLG